MILSSSKKAGIWVVVILTAKKWPMNLTRHSVSVGVYFFRGKPILKNDSNRGSSEEVTGTWLDVTNTDTTESRYNLIEAWSDKYDKSRWPTVIWFAWFLILFVFHPTPISTATSTGLQKWEPGNHEVKILHEQSSLKTFDFSAFFSPRVGFKRSIFWLQSPHHFLATIFRA